MKWQGLDDGREGLLTPGNWYAVLQTLARHEGEDYRQPDAPMYQELSKQLPDISWTGGSGDRYFFRDYAKPWLKFGVLEREGDGMFHVSEAGQELLSNPALLTDFFRNTIQKYLEKWEIGNDYVLVPPYLHIANSIIRFQNQGRDSFSAIDLKEASEADAILYGHATSGDARSVARRRFRTYLVWLENAKAIKIGRSAINITDIEFIRGIAGPNSIVEIIDEVPDLDLDYLSQDMRRVLVKEVYLREGQQKFKQDIMNAYAKRCCISGTTEATVLEAAHILPYRGTNTNIVSNGLLLAVDLHRLFDRNKIAINPHSLRVELHNSVTDSRYQQYQDRLVSIPQQHRPQVQSALSRRYEAFGMSDS